MMVGLTIASNGFIDEYNKFLAGLIYLLIPPKSIFLNLNGAACLSSFSGKEHSMVKNLRSGDSIDGNLSLFFPISS